MQRFRFLIILSLLTFYLNGQTKDLLYFEAIDKDITWIVATLPDAPCNKPYRCNELNIVKLKRDTLINDSTYKIVDVYSEFHDYHRFNNGLIRQDNNKITWINKSEKILLRDNSQRFHVFNLDLMSFDTLSITRLYTDLGNNESYIKTKDLVWINLLDYIVRIFSYNTESRYVGEKNGKGLVIHTMGGPLFKIIAIIYKGNSIYLSDDYKRYGKRLKNITSANKGSTKIGV